MRISSRINLRNLGWLAALGVTLWLTWNSHQQAVPESSLEPVLPRLQAQTPIQPMPGGQQVDKPALSTNAQAAAELVLLPRPPVASQSSLFTTPRHVLRKAASGSVERAAPVLPALPFQYLGLWQQQKERKVLLESNGDVLTVSVGESITPQYRLQAIVQDAGGTQVKILYLPFNKIQTLWVAPSP